MTTEDLRSLDDIAREHVVAVLHAYAGNQTNAARVLGIDRKTIARMLSRWGIAAPSAKPRPVRPGSLIAFDGLDGARTGAQATRLVAFLTARGHAARLTSEPSSGPVGALVRQLAAADGHTLGLVLAADRVDHYHRVVAPALATGVTIVCDRSHTATIAHHRTRTEREWAADLDRHARAPDVTIYLDVTPAPEQRDAAAGYRAAIAEARADGERIEVVDGDRSPDEVFAAVTLALALGD